MITPLICDNFAGGGGASTGIEAAIGRSVDVAINHDPEAVAMHAANHPATLHLCQSIMAVDPLDATGGQPVALAWFSPDCKHHSKAKGGKPREKNIRDLAWIVPHWPERLLKATPDGRGAPAVLMLENVEEFRQWGPLDADGMPIKERRGEEFDLWCRRLKRLGYKLEHRELRACDYGAPTSRKRLYMIARRDGRPIVWPTASYGKPGSAEVLSGERQPWRTAAECIDWTIACPSIFTRARPLKEATNRRIAHGVMRYVANAAKPFVVRAAHGDDGRHRTHPVEVPLGTQPASNEFAVVDATIAPVIVGCGGRRGQSGPVDIAGPYPTTTAKADACLVEAGIVPITHTQGGNVTTNPAEPMRTVTTAKGGEFARATVTLAPHITKFRNGAVGSAGDDPMPTVTANGNPARPAGAQPLALAAATLVQTGYGEREGQAPRTLDVAAPLGTVVAGGAKHAAVTAFLSSFYTSNTRASGGDPTEPVRSVTAEGQHHAVVCAHMEQANTGTMLGREADKPVTTITATGSQQRLVETTMIGADALPPELLDRAVQVAAFLIKYYGNETDGHGMDAPIGTVTTRDRFAVVTVTIDAVTYVIVDIGMRMLTPRELARAQGFPDSYILDPIGPNGRPLPKSAQIRMIGNSVCPDVAEALVRANLPELCTGTIPAEAAA